jgi:hypothetical protein
MRWWPSFTTLTRAVSGPTTDTTNLKVVVKKSKSQHFE